MKFGIKKGSGGANIPESLLNATNIVHLPVVLGSVFFADRDTGPGHAHECHAVHVVLVEFDFERAEVTLGPLGETPFLDDEGRRVELDVFAVDVAIEDGELAADVGAVELARRAAGEDCDALRVGEGVVELFGRGAELI